MKIAVICFHESDFHCPIVVIADMFKCYKSLCIDIKLDYIWIQCKDRSYQMLAMVANAKVPNYYQFFLCDYRISAKLKHK